VINLTSPIFKTSWTESMAQAIEHLLFKHEALRSNPSSKIKTDLRPTQAKNL
jgi:hypothetical protein